MREIEKKYSQNDDSVLSALFISVSINFMKLGIKDNATLFMCLCC